MDGFLYYLVNDWYEISENQGLNSKHEINPDFPYDVYGNGVLLYCGAPFDEYGPVGSLRLECVRDGIEHGDAEQTIASFTKAVERFANMK